MKLKKSLVSIVAVLCFVSGTVTLNGLGRFVEDEQTKIYALEKDNIGDATIAYEYIENALFPCHGKTKISQTAFENGTPPSGDEASHFLSNAMDVIPEDGYFYAPYSGRIVAYSDLDGYCNAFAYVSENKVRLSDDSFDYLTMYVLHSNDDEVIKANIGNLIHQNDMITIENGDEKKAISMGGALGPGNYSVFGKHFDIQVKKGKNNTINDVRYNGDELAYECLFVNPNLTTFIEYPIYDRAFNINPKDDPYEGKWVENSAFQESGNTSVLKICCPNDLAFEEEYSLFDLLFGDVIAVHIQKLDTINRIVNSYTTINYDDLNEFEKYIYDSCKLEWIDDFSDNESFENDNDEESTKAEANTTAIEETSFSPSEGLKGKYTISFDLNGGICDDCSEIIITSGVCSSVPFPVPEKIGSIFLGWFDENGVEYTNNSIIERDVVLFAKWIDLPMIESSNELKENTPTTTPCMEKTVVKTETTEEIINIMDKIVEDAIKLSHETIILNTAGQSKTFKIGVNSENPNDIEWMTSDSDIATVKNGLIEAKSDGIAIITAISKNGSIDTCEVNVCTSFTEIYGEWSEWKKEPIAKTDDIEIETEIRAEKIESRYITDSYSGRTWEKERVYDNKMFDAKERGLDDIYGVNYMSASWMFGLNLTFSAEEFGKFEVIRPGEYSQGAQWGKNISDQNGYNYKDGYIVFIKDIIWEEVPVTYYRSRICKKAPITYYN